MAAPLDRTIAIIAFESTQQHRPDSDPAQLSGQDEIRLDILRSIQQAGFAILEERRETWTRQQDADFLAEFFAHGDAADEASAGDGAEEWISQLTKGPIYLLVLERKSATGLWLDMLQGSDGLRSKYPGVALYGSPSSAIAKHQVDMCFPELAPEDVGATSEDEAEEVPVRRGAVNGGRTAARSAPASVPSPPAGSVAAPFRARAAPSSTRSKPAIEPRLSRAAALRLGVALPPMTPKRTPSRQSAAAGELENVGISGLVRGAVEVPRSLAKPTMEVRLNKSTLARLGGAREVPASEGRERVPVDFSNTPGHKRASLSGSLRPASLASPTITPRTNRASQARASVLLTPAPSAAVGDASQQRRMSLSLSPAPGARSPLGSFAVRQPTGMTVGADSRRASLMLSRTGSTASAETASTSGEPHTPRERKPVDFSNTPGHKRDMSGAARPASLHAPRIAPRLNKAAAARLFITSDGTAVGGKENLSPARPASAFGASSTRSGTSSEQQQRERKAVDYSNTPGHRRSFSGAAPVASLRSPSIAPRMNAAAAARLAAGGTDSSSPVRTTKAPPPSAYNRYSTVLGTPTASASRG